MVCQFLTNHNNSINCISTDISMDNIILTQKLNSIPRNSYHCFSLSLFLLFSFHILKGKNNFDSESIKSGHAKPKKDLLPAQSEREKEKESEKETRNENRIETHSHNTGATPPVLWPPLWTVASRTVPSLYFVKQFLFSLYFCFSPLLFLPLQPFFFTCFSRVKKRKENGTTTSR